MFLQKGRQKRRIRDAHEKKHEHVSKHMIGVLFDNDAQMQGQTLNKYAIFNDQFKHWISVLRDNDAQMEVHHAKKLSKKSDVYKHRVSVLRVNTAQMDKTTSLHHIKGHRFFNLRG